MSAVARPVVALMSDAVYSYFRGGKEFRYHELSTRLGRRADAHIVTMKWWDGSSTRRDGCVTFHAVSPLYPMYTGERRSFQEAIFFALACLRLLWCRFDFLEADQFSNFHIFTLRLVTWLKRKPLTVTWHEVWDAAVDWSADLIHVEFAVAAFGTRTRALLAWCGPRPVSRW
jgi:hypothetical protein